MSSKLSRRHLLGALLAALVGSWCRRLPAAPPVTTHDPRRRLPTFSSSSADARVVRVAHYTYDGRLTCCQDVAGPTPTTVYDARGGQLPLYTATTGDAERYDELS
jgi:hypothetical protein